MKHVVMGTAGHIDHGKTALVKRLTGIDTDRLQEEKRRGMTIELGFAPLKLTSGNVISIVDVPGHEKFIKTMVAGVSSIDFVILVIAADEGIMPQTREHMDILSMLNVKAGAVALNKVDLVEDEWLDMVIGNVKNEIKGTFLENCDIIPVSSLTGEGIDKLLEKLEELAEEAATGEPQEFFRMPIDRVFTIQGYGTVITGTSLGGKVRKGDIISILPSGTRVKVRGIQVHNQKVEYAEAGERCALNISGIEKCAVERGAVASGETWITPVIKADAVLFTTKGKYSITNNQRVHVNIGTKEVLARIKVIGAEEVAEGSKGYIQIKFEEPVVILRGDRFIIRNFSPVVTLGGGRILSHVTRERSRFRKEDMEALEIEETGNTKSLIKLVMNLSGRPVTLEEIWHMVLGNKGDIINILFEEIAAGEIIVLKTSDKYISRSLCDRYIKSIDVTFIELGNRFPFKFELDKEEIKSRLFSKLDTKEFTDLINYYVENNVLISENNMIRKNDHRVIEEIMKMKEIKLLENVILQNGLNVKSSDQIRKEIHLGANKLLSDNYEDIKKLLIKTGKIINLGNDILIHNNIFQDSVNKIRQVFRINEFITAVFVRDYLKCSRKAAVLILEYLDSLGITERHGNLRKPGVHYMDLYIHTG